MNCQKIVNVIALTSGVVSLAVVGSGLFVFVNRDSIVDNIKSQAIEAALGGLGGIGGGLPTGANDLPGLGATPSLGGPAIAPPAPELQTSL